MREKILKELQQRMFNALDDVSTQGLDMDEVWHDEVSDVDRCFLADRLVEEFFKPENDFFVQEWLELRNKPKG